MRIFDDYKQRGMATRLIAYLELLAIKFGYDVIGLGVGLYRDYGNAQQLYYKLGYKPDGEGISYKGISIIPGEPYPIDDELILWLTKQLR